jgi:histidinol-phosphatase
VTEEGQGGQRRYAPELALALRMADSADELTVRRFQALDLVVETKPDLTPVSDADKATEELLRTALAESYPRDAIVGEEMGGDSPDQSWAGRRWVLDPIDGTKNYVRGVPVWATLIALVDGSQAVVGVVSAPALGRRWWASRGSGAWAGGALVGTPRRIGVSAVASLADASLSYSDVAGWPDGGATFRDLAGRCWRTRAYGDFWSHLLVAEGAVDVAVEPELSVWDVAALVPVVQEAGGRITGRGGGPAIFGGGAVTTNGRLHGQVLRVLGATEAGGAAAG